MKNTPYIRSFVSLLLIIIFACSITPKKTIHNWIADHKDQTAASTAKHGTLLGVAGYHCNTDSLVTESPFTLFIQPYIFQVPTIVSIQKGEAITNFYSLHHFYSELRGPPVA